MEDLSPESGAPEAPAVPSPEQGALGAQQPDSPVGGDDAPQQYDENGQPIQSEPPVQRRIDELTFHRRRAERVAAEAIQENAALRQHLAQIAADRGLPAPQPNQNAVSNQPQPQGDAPPRQEDFDDWGSFMRAMANFEVRQMVAREQQNRMTYEQAQRQALAQAQHAHAERVREATLTGVVEQGRQAYQDFERVISNPQLPQLRDVHPMVLDAVAYSENAKDILYFLGKNVGEAKRIASLHPVAAVRELGKLEGKISQGYQHTSSAPQPFTTVRAGSGSATDPLSDRADIETWMRARNQQAAKRR